MGEKQVGDLFFNVFLLESRVGPFSALVARVFLSQTCSSIIDTFGVFEYWALGGDETDTCVSKHCTAFETVWLREL